MRQLSLSRPITRADCIFMQTIVTTNVCSVTNAVSRETLRNVREAIQSQQTIFTALTIFRKSESLPTLVT